MSQLWIDWVKQLQAIAQNGLAYSENAYDLERYRQLKHIAAEILETHSNHDFQKIHDFLDQDTGYVTPKVDVRGVVFENDGILLVQERIDEKWTLPGGWADPCLTPSENVVKEIHEESGYRTRAVKLLAVYDRDKQGHVPKFPFHIYKMYFLCEIIGGSPRPSIETMAAEFFEETQIPELSLSKVTPRQISRMFTLYRDGTESADFD